MQVVDADLGSVGFSLRTRESSEGIVSRLVKPKYRGLIWTHLFLKNRFRTNHERGLDLWIYTLPMSFLHIPNLKSETRLS